MNSWYTSSNYAVRYSPDMRSQRDQSNCAVDLPSSIYAVNMQHQLQPSFSGRTTKRDVSDQEVNLMMGEVPAPETLLDINNKDNGLCPTKIINAQYT